MPERIWVIGIKINVKLNVRKLERMPPKKVYKVYECMSAIDIKHGNIRRNVNSDFSIITMRRVAIIFFELGVVKNFMQIF